MARGKGNPKLEMALDETALSAFENEKKRVDRLRKDEKDKEKLTELAKYYARLNLLIRRANTRIANRIAGPKAKIDLDELL